MDELTKELDQWREAAEQSRLIAESAIDSATKHQSALQSAETLIDRLKAENESLSRELEALRSGKPEAEDKQETSIYTPGWSGKRGRF